MSMRAVGTDRAVRAKGVQVEFPCGRHALAALALLLIAGLVSCSSGDAGHPTGIELAGPKPGLAQGPPPKAGLPDLASIEAIAAQRSSSGFEFEPVENFLSKSANASLLDAGSAKHLRLDPGPEPGSFSWALFSLSTIPHDLFDATLELNAVPSDGSEELKGSLWAAVPDFNKGAWQWFRFADWSQEVDLPAGGAAFNAQGEIPVVIVAFGQSFDLSGQIFLRDNYGTGIYAYSYPDHIHLSWSNYAALDTVEYFEIYYRPAGLPEASFTLLVQLPGDVHSFDQSAANPAGKPCQLGHEYEYCLLVNDGGLLHLDDMRDTAKRELMPPDYFDATTDLLANAVALNWPATSFHDGYRIYREDALLATLDSSARQYIDTSPQLADGKTYKYQIEAFNAEGASVRRSSDGRAGKLNQVTVLADTDAACTFGGLQQRRIGDALRSEFSFYDPAGSGLQYVYSEAQPPQTDADFSFISLPDGGQGQFSSMAMVSGKPVVAFSSSSGLRLCQSSTASPDSSGDWSSTLVDAASTGRHVQLIDFYGTPLLCYQDESGHLVYAQTGQAQPQGPADWTRVVIQPQGLSGEFACLGVLGYGLPGVFYVLEEDELSQPAGWLRAAVSGTPTPDALSDFDVYDLAPAAQVSGRPVFDQLSLQNELFNVAWVEQSGPLEQIRMARSSSSAQDSADDWTVSDFHIAALAGTQITSLALFDGRVFYVERAPGGAWTAVQYLTYTPPLQGLVEITEPLSSGFAPTVLPVTAAGWLEGRLSFAVLAHDAQSGNQKLVFAQKQ